MQRIFALPVGLGRVLNAVSHNTLPTVPLSAPRSALTVFTVEAVQRPELWTSLGGASVSNFFTKLCCCDQESL